MEIYITRRTVKRITNAAAAAGLLLLAGCTMAKGQNHHYPKTNPVMPNGCRIQVTAQPPGPFHYTITVINPCGHKIKPEALMLKAPALGIPPWPHKWLDTGRIFTKPGTYTVTVPGNVFRWDEYGYSYLTRRGHTYSMTKGIVPRYVWQFVCCNRCHSLGMIHTEPGPPQPPQLKTRLRVLRALVRTLPDASVIKPHTCRINNGAQLVCVIRGRRYDGHYLAPSPFPETSYVYFDIGGTTAAPTLSYNSMSH